MWCIVALGRGVGSFVSRWFEGIHATRVIALAAAGVGVWLIIAILAYPAIVRAALPMSLAGRSLVAGIAILPLGFLMGIPFPGGLRLAGDADPNGVPLFWGMNALASTLGAVLATVIAILAGFNVALGMAAEAYLFVAGPVSLTWHRVVL